MIIHNPILTGSLSLNGTNLSTSNIVTTGSNTFVGNQVVSGSLTVSGSITTNSTLTAQTLVVQTITSSVDFVTGSTRFGSRTSDTHDFTGSVRISGSLTSTGSITTIAPTGNANLIIQTLQAAQNTQIQFVNTAKTVYIGNQIASAGSMFEVHDASLGASRLLISSSGNVGIGTTTPNYKLHVYNPNSASYFDGGTTDTSFYISHGSSTPGNQTIAGLRTNTGSPVINAKNGGTIFFNRDVNAANVEFQYSTGSNTALFISSSGRIGINNTNPLSLLDVTVLASGARRLFVNYDDSLVTIKSANNSSTAESLRVWGDNIYFYTGSAGSELMRLTNTGRVGIGTSIPSGSRLHVFIGNDGGSGTPGVILATSNGANDIVRFQDGTTTVAVVKNSGYIGIGTTAPGGPLHIGGALASSGDAAAITLKQTSTTAATGIYLERSGEQKGYYMYVGGSVDSLTFQRNNAGTKADVMALSRDGNVGIGTTSPLDSTKFGLQITSPAGKASYARVNYTGLTGLDLIQGSDGTGYLVLNDNNDLRIYTNLTERMRITSGGYLKASSNSTYVDVVGSYHELRGNASNGYELIVSNVNTTPASQYVISSRFSSSTPNNTSARFLDCEDSTATRAYIRSNGGFSNYQANDTNLSDIRTKKDIVSLESYWDKFKAIEVVKFKYKDQTHDDYNIGVIAQQVEEVAPEFVDVDGWGETPEDGVPLKSIYTADLHHATIKVLQEAMAKIETLEARVQQLENK